jgi:hypothetical protein
VNLETHALPNQTEQTAQLQGKAEESNDVHQLEDKNPEENIQQKDGDNHHPH